MSKPDDIPQGVWDASENLILALEEHVDFSNDGRIRPSDMDKQYDQIQELIARAIKESRSEERAACITTVLSFIEYGGDIHHGITMNPKVDAREIAVALRKTGRG
jgi:hypothetical protein